MIKAIPTDIYNKDGDLVEIQFHKLDGEFIVVATWDPNDEQTSANREEFRKWAYKMVTRLNYEVDK
jgi:hypothetical protein